jgi:hypothetical protein
MSGGGRDGETATTASSVEDLPSVSERAVELAPQEPTSNTSYLREVAEVLARLDEEAEEDGERE